MKYQILQGDNRQTLKTIADNSIDAIVTDPPYGIEFLGKSWDANTGALETYQECLRVLKPGGHILAFSAARTYHHLAITLEQAGFEIRDQIMWIYSSGFPKSHDVGKNNNLPKWLGWGTALKPAHEPIALARKPIKQSVAKNCQQWNTGAINIDATRVDQRFPSNVLGEITEPYQKYFYCPKVSRRERHSGFDLTNIPSNPDGIWDNGVQFQEKKQSSIPTYKEMILEMGGIYIDENGNEQDINLPSKDIKLPEDGYIKAHSLKDVYEKWCIRHNKIQNKGNNHPTVKPVELMKYLIKLITPPNGRVLDPFNGSGSTGMAAVELGHEYIGCELDPAYVEISRKRIAAWNKENNTFSELFS